MILTFYKMIINGQVFINTTIIYNKKKMRQLNLKYIKKKKEEKLKIDYKKMLDK